MKTAAAACLALFLAGCAASTSPSPAGSHLPADEKALHDAAARVDEAVAAAGFVVEDPALQAYVDGVVARLAPAFGGSAPVRVRIVRDPFLGASMSVNGSLYLHTGLLARVGNEAQLAGVMAHEIHHFRSRDVQRTIRAQKSRRAAVTAAGLLLLGVPLVGTVFLAESENMVESGKLAYSRSLESEADLAAVRALAATGYDPGQMALYFELLAREEAEAGINDPYLYDDHPATLVRQRDCEREAARLRARDATIATHVGTGAHERAITSVLLPTAEMNLKLRRIEHARFEIERYVRLRPEAGDGHLALGDVLRRRAGGSVEKLAEAEKAYLRAVQLDPDLAAARRELGLVYRAQGRSREAREQLTRYLALAPAAPDRGIIEAYID